MDLNLDWYIAVGNDDNNRDDRLISFLFVPMSPGRVAMENNERTVFTPSSLSLGRGQRNGYRPYVPEGNSEMMIVLYVTVSLGRVVLENSERIVSLPLPSSLDREQRNDYRPFCASAARKFENNDRIISVSPPLNSSLCWMQVPVLSARGI